MSWRNIIENIVLIVVMFVGLGIYTSIVLKPIIIESIRTETHKIENNITSKIDNKFKKIDELKASLPYTVPIDNAQTLPSPTHLQDCFMSLQQFNSLSDGEQRRLRRWLED